MKKSAILLFAVVLLNLSEINGQSGTIVYEEVVKFEIKLEGEMAQMMKDMPKERCSSKVLFFSPEATLYEKKSSDEAPAMSGFAHAGSNIQIKMSEPDNKVFIDLVNKEIIEQREFMTRMFLITGEIPKTDWKITGNQKMILDYPCMEATKSDTAGVITKVWFAPSLPLQGGPSTFCNLPGMVMAVDISDGKQMLTAQSIDLNPPGKEKFKRPKEGKKVTKDEFDKIVTDKMEEMGIEGEGTHGDATIMIRVKH
ncbi:MAG: GLPGLI family protein [Bacteroidales bacterium]|nr:GLPGLI family protein [Bacteroidales bacterium]